MGYNNTRVNHILTACGFISQIYKFSSQNNRNQEDRMATP